MGLNWYDRKNFPRESPPRDARQKEERRFEGKDDDDWLHACRTGNGKEHEEPRHGQDEQLDEDVVGVLHLAHERVELGECRVDVLDR